MGDTEGENRGSDSDRSCERDEGRNGTEEAGQTDEEGKNGVIIAGSITGDLTQQDLFAEPWVETIENKVNF